MGRDFWHDRWYKWEVCYCCIGVYIEIDVDTLRDDVFLCNAELFLMCTNIINGVLGHNSA